MQVENFECQIAQAQIGNFLAGSGLSEEAVGQLEEHIAGCAGCKAALSAKRNELKALLNQDRAVVDLDAVQQEVIETKPKSISSALRKKSLQQLVESESFPEPKSAPNQAAELNYAAIAAALGKQLVAEPTDKKAKTKVKAKPAAKAAVQTEAKPSNYWKPLVYSVGLGAVLVGMSLFSNNLASIFGPKANAAGLAPAPTTNSTDGTTTSTPATTPGGSDSATQTTGGPVTGELVGSLPPQTGPSDQTTSNGTATVPTPETKPETTPIVESEPITTEPLVGSTYGVVLGALATTQFDAPEEAPVQQPTVQPEAQPKPKTIVKQAPVVKPQVIKKPAKRTVTRRNVARKPVRRVVTKRPAVRSRGIKVYQP